MHLQIIRTVFRSVKSSSISHIVQHFNVSASRVRLLTQSQYLPHQHPKGPREEYHLNIHVEKLQVVLFNKIRISFIAVSRNNTIFCQVRFVTPF